MSCFSGKCGLWGGYGLGYGLGCGLGGWGYGGYGLGCGLGGYGGYGLGCGLGGYGGYGLGCGLGLGASTYPLYSCNLPCTNSAYPFWGLGPLFYPGYNNCLYPYLGGCYSPWNNCLATTYVPSDINPRKRRKCDPCDQV